MGQIEIVYYVIGCNSNTNCICGTPAKKHNQNLIMGKEKSKCRGILQRNFPIIYKNVQSHKSQGKTVELCQNEWN